MITLVSLAIVFNGRSLLTSYGIPSAARDLGVATAKFNHRHVVPGGMIVEEGADMIERELELATARLAREFHGAWDTYPLWPQG